MNRRLKTKRLFQNLTALTSLLTLIFIILTPFFHELEKHLTLNISPFTYFFINLSPI